MKRRSVRAQEPQAILACELKVSNRSRDCTRCEGFPRDEERSPPDKGTQTFSSQDRAEVTSVNAVFFAATRRPRWTEYRRALGEQAS
jgi:hypothetical protein